VGKIATEASPQAKGARRCTNPECEYGGRWIVGGMRFLKNGKFSCLGKGCHTVYRPEQVIDPANGDYWLWVRWRAGLVDDPAFWGGLESVGWYLESSTRRGLKAAIHFSYRLLRILIGH
jgi:hypothetical protein